MPLDITWAPDPVVVADDFYEAAAALENLEIPLTESIPAVMSGMESIFEAEGPGWAPWAESYAPYAETHNVGILRQTGALYGSVGDAGNYAVASDTLAWTGASAPSYWGFHPEGTSKMPARPFIGLTPESEMAVLAIFEAWLSSIIAAEATGAGQIVFRGPGGRFFPGF